MIARGAIHNPKIFEEFKNSYDQLDLDEERELAEREFKEDDLDNDVFEIIEENKPEKLNKSKSDINREEKDIELNFDENNKKEENKKGKKKNKNENEEVKTSQNLVRIFDLKYQGKNFDLIPILKDYLTLVNIIFL